MRTEVLNSVDPVWWNGLLKQSNQATVFQTAEWGLWFQKVFYSTIYYVIIYDNTGEILAQCLVSKQAPKKSVWSGYRWLWPFVSVGKNIYPVLSWSHGPIMHCEKDRWQSVLLEFQKTLLKLIQFGRIEYSTFPQQLSEYYRNNNIPITKFKTWGTFIVDLDKSPEELWRGLKSSARKNLKKLQDSNISVRIVNDQIELKELYPDFCKWTRRIGGKVYDWKYAAMRSDCLQTINGERYYVAFKDQTPLACLGIWGYGSTIFEFGALQSQQSVDEKIYGQDLIKWNVILNEKERGFSFYDLTGVNPDPQTPKEENIFQFKKKWGGAFVQYPLITKL